jgi:hypothetical protein
MPSSAPRPPDFWPTIQRYGSNGAPGINWRTAAGTSFHLLKPFLAPFPGAPAGAVSCPRCGLTRRISHQRDSLYIMEQPNSCGSCKADRSITLDDITRYRINPATFIPAAAQALGLAQPAGNTPSPSLALLPLGTTLCGVETLPVVILFPNQLAAINLDLLFPTPERRVILHFTPEPALVAALHRRSFSLFHLPSMLDPLENTSFRARTTIPEALSSATGKQVETQKPPVPLKGRRFEIAPDYSWVRKLTGKRASFDITNLQTRFALRALVESGADSEVNALPKAIFCRRVHELSGKLTPMPKELSPAQFFRRFVDGKNQAYPFYAALVGKNDHGGLYWLKT